VRLGAAPLLLWGRAGGDYQRVALCQKKCGCFATFSQTLYFTGFQPINKPVIMVKIDKKDVILGFA
jgi:hypothetical protein